MSAREKKEQKKGCDNPGLKHGRSDGHAVRTRHFKYSFRRITFRGIDLRSASALIGYMLTFRALGKRRAIRFEPRTASDR